MKVWCAFVVSQASQYIRGQQGYWELLDPVSRPCVAVLYKEPCQSLILLIVRCIWWFNFWTLKPFTLPKSTATFSDCMGKVSWMKMKNVCQMGSKNAHRWTRAEEAKEAVTDYLNGLVASFNDEGIVRLVQHQDKFQNYNGDYIENMLYLAKDIKIIWTKENGSYLKNDLLICRKKFCLHIL
jgi:hypothetical protein